MGRGFVLFTAVLFFCCLPVCLPENEVLAQTADGAAGAPVSGPTAPLKSIHAEGIHHLSEPQLIALSGLTVGSAVGKQDLQAAADRLVQTGLFSTVNYSFQSKE